MVLAISYRLCCFKRCHDRRNPDFSIELAWRSRDRRSAHKGQIGDGKIFVASINGVMRIRTGDTDEAAL
jgi:hypothetical protein